MPVNQPAPGNGAGPGPLRGTADSVLAGGLISAPAWAPSLSSINEVLTTLTLLLGVALAAVRLWLLVKRRRDRTTEEAGGRR